MPTTCRWLLSGRLSRSARRPVCLRISPVICPVARLGGVVLSRWLWLARRWALEMGVVGLTRGDLLA